LKAGVTAARLGVRARLFALLVLVNANVLAEERVAQLANGQTVEYRLIEGDKARDEKESARPTALRILRHLADGNIEQAALLSNAPKRRFEVLRDYRAQVGDHEFKRVYAQYFFPENRVVAELAVGPRRVVVWDLGEAGHQLAAQYFVEVEGKFLMDDVPSEERSRLRQLLAAYRKENAATSPARKD
jgi:hypothetical protein